MKKIRAFLPLLLVCLFIFSACSVTEPETDLSSDFIATVNDVPPFSDGTPYVAINGNQPVFKESELTAVSYEKYSELDELGRCGAASACIGIDIMPTEKRGSIGQVKPTGWQTVKYDCVEGKYLYNRCHLIGYQLSGENANKLNLITGTRYLNTEGMLPFENMIADYVKETKNHVLYRVTPIYDGDNLLARGVQMEAQSVEDNGEGICFNVYAYNCQPQIEIDYKTGASYLKGSGNNLSETKPSAAEESETEETKPSEPEESETEETEPSATEKPETEETKPSTSGSSSSTETKPSTSGNSSSTETKPSTSGNSSSTETKPSTSGNSGNTEIRPDTSVNANKNEYVLNTNTKKFHFSGCSSAKKIKDENRQVSTKTAAELIAEGYDPCKKCNP